MVIVVVLFVVVVWICLCLLLGGFGGLFRGRIVGEEKMLKTRLLVRKKAKKKDCW